MRRSLAALWITAAGLGASRALATETQLWVTDSAADYAKAEAHGVVVAADGALVLGPAATSTPVEGLTVIWALATLKDGSVALAGEGGRLLRWTESQGIRPWATLDAGQVFCLAADGDGVVAGTGPQGLVYRVSARGDTVLLARTGERYVWGIAAAGRDAWYAATGTRGRLLRIENRRARTVLDTDESNLVSLIGDGHGGAFAGGDSKGRVFHVPASGPPTTVFDASEDEVRALALGADGALYAAGLSASATILDEGGEEKDAEKKPDESPQPARSAVGGARCTVYRIVPDSSAAPVWSATQPFVFALARSRGPLGEGILAATGNRAGVYRILGTNQAEQWLAAPQGQVTALALDPRGRVFAATSNPGALWRLGPGIAERGELLSPALDARRFARFGSVHWYGDRGGGSVQLLSRSGNTESPDTTWSAWAAAEGDRIASPPARYLQWRIVLGHGHPRVTAVETAWREQNLAPRVEDLVVAPQGIGFREGDLQPRSEPVTQTLPGGQKVEYSTSTSSPKALRSLPAWAQGLRTIQWKGSDPNGDPLRYRVDVRSEDHDEWIQLGEDLESTSFTWDTKALPDGRYRVRVRASDAPGNPVGEERTAEVLSEPFTIDNTSPAVTELEARGEPGAALVTGRAEDGESMLTRLEIALDDGDWRTLSPAAGLTDERQLTFRARLPDLEPGAHTVSVRAVDRAGNAATRAVRVTIPKGR